MLLNQSCHDCCVDIAARLSEYLDCDVSSRNVCSAAEDIVDLSIELGQFEN